MRCVANTQDHVDVALNKAKEAIEHHRMETSKEHATPDPEGSCLEALTATRKCLQDSKTVLQNASTYVFLFFGLNLQLQVTYYNARCSVDENVCEEQPKP